MLIENSRLCDGSACYEEFATSFGELLGIKMNFGHQSPHDRLSVSRPVLGSLSNARVERSIQLWMSEMLNFKTRMFMYICRGKFNEWERIK